MTPHLRESEFVDLLDRVLPAARLLHLEECQSCRDEADTLARTLAAADDQSIPEPSPLFWEHFSARVRAAIEEEPRPARPWRLAPMLPAARWAAAGTIAVLILGVLIWRSGAPAGDRPTPSAQHATIEPASTPAGADEDPFGDIDGDEAWALVRSVADELDVDEIKAAGIGTRPGAVERVANGLSDIERLELAELIEHEIKTGRAAGPSS
jgi:hypothetical protein